MAYELHYTRKIVHNHGTEDEPNIVEYLQEESVGATDADYDVQMAFAKEHSYNGEVTVEEVDDPELSVEEQIAALKEQLSSTDYKIIKCSEASLVGEELPYDITALHAERQAIREQINALEGA